MNASSFLRPISIVGFVAAFSVLAPVASAVAGFEKLQGDYTGGFDGTGAFQPSGGTPTQQEYQGVISGGVRPKSLGKTGSFSFVVIGVSPAKTTSFVRLDFKSHGRVKTSALVPGMIALPAIGKWKSAAGGKVVHFTLTAATSDGTYTAVCILKGDTAQLGLKITVTSSIMSSSAPNSAQFIFVGDKDKTK